MQIDQSNRSFAIHPIFLAISVGIHVLIVQGIVVYSRLHPTTPPPAITEIIEVAMFELPAPAAPVIEPEPMLQPELEPVSPEPEPEPIPPEPEPEPEPVKIVAPDTPVEPPPKVEKPKPVEVPKPKTREELIRERFKNSPISQDDPKKREAERKEAERQRREQEEALKRLQKTLDNVASGFKPSTIAPATTSQVIGVSADQMSKFTRYMSSCVTPEVNRLWQKLGPTGLENLPTPATISIVIDSTGRVLSYMFAKRSNSATVNDAADALGKALMQKGLPPFRQVGLATDGNAPLTIDFTLKYER